LFAKACALDHNFEESVPDCHCEDGCSEFLVIKYCLMTVRKATELRDFKATEPFLEAFKKSVQDRGTEMRFGTGFPCNQTREALLDDAQSLSAIYHRDRPRFLS
jgi:hypothetical protein